jgi:hypothetical protein
MSGILIPEKPDKMLCSPYPNLGEADLGDLDVDINVN